MQFYALDTRGKLLSAPAASRKIPYRCPSCFQPVQLKGGMWRRLHFYHTKPSSPCRVKQNSFIHQFFQYQIQKELPDAQIEHGFPEIGRIADVFWPAENIVFEIQCSPIRVEEVASRNRDYGRLGLTVVWILSERRYNKKRVHPIEYALRAHPHYFVDRAGRIYDQYATFARGVRENFSPPFFIQLKAPRRDFEKKLDEWRDRWPLSFEGDLFHRDWKVPKKRLSRKRVLEALDRCLEAFYKATI